MSKVPSKWYTDEEYQMDFKIRTADKENVVKINWFQISDYARIQRLNLGESIWIEVGWGAMGQVTRIK